MIITIDLNEQNTKVRIEDKNQIYSEKMKTTYIKTLSLKDIINWIKRERYTG